MGAWKQPVFLASMTTQGMVNPKYGSAVPFAPGSYINFTFSQFNVDADYKKNIKDTTGLLKNNLVSVSKKLKREVNKSSKSLDSFSPQKLDFKNLQVYTDLVSSRARQWYEIMIIDGALMKLYPDSLPKKFKLGNIEYTPASLLTIVALPKKLFPMIEERMDFLGMAIDLKKGKNITARLKKHSSRYSWMNSLCWWDEPYTVDFYFNQAKKLAKRNPASELEKTIKDRKSSYEAADKLLRELKEKYPKGWQCINVIRDLTDLKEDNWDAVSYAGVRMRPLFKDLAKKHHLSYSQLMQLSPLEMIKLMKTKKLPVSLKILNSRLKNFLIVSFDKSNQKVFSGADIKIARQLIEKKPAPTNTLEGTPIWQGKTKGEVCLILSPDDVGKMKKDQVMVCPMSDPDYMPAIRKAKAIITDQGGLLCHAAIVARELQVPCIVGTEIATKILKDGDRVGFDAYKGVIKII